MDQVPEKQSRNRKINKNVFINYKRLLDEILSLKKKLRLRPIFQSAF